MNSPYMGNFKVTQEYKGATHDGLDLVGQDSKNIHSTVNGVVEYAGQRTLTQHLAEVCLKHVKAVAPHKVGTQRWRLLFSHWRQLGGVADEHKAAVATVVDILCKVIEQASAAKNRLCEAVVGYHRRLVHDEECVGMEVVVKAERAFKRFLTIYLAMYGVRWAAGIERQHLCGAACRSQQHHLASH